MRFQLQNSDDLVKWHAVAGAPGVIDNPFGNVKFGTSVDDHRRHFLRLKALKPLDSDGDTMNDLEDTLLGSQPSSADSDADGIDDCTEFEAGTNPILRLSDTDGDGHSDLREILEPESDLLAPFYPGSQQPTVPRLH